MASYTDKIMQFNPYVPQLPLEAMAQVGMYKQQKYEENVQKIQSQIDTIAGLDVIKPIHKKYLQSKLDELGNNLKTVAAADFSNFQIVNSVGGMTNQIVRDPIVQNAVTSTMRKRKEDSNIQEAQKAGKSSPDNEDYFNDQFNEWINDGKLETPFTGEFIEYTDVDKKLRDLADKLKVDEIGVDNPFIKNNAGQTLYFYKDPKTGKTVSSIDPSMGTPQIDLGMTRVKVKGVSAQRILNNFYDSLDANDIRQLKINSWAKYRGVGAEPYKQDIIAAYKDKKEIISQELVNLNVKYKDPNLTSEEQTAIKTQITKIDDLLKNKKLEKDLEEDLANLDTKIGLEDFKYKVYSQRYLTNLAKDISYKSYVTEWLSNPLEQADMARKNFQLEVQKRADDLWKFKTTEKRLQSKDDFEKYKWMVENAPTQPTVLGGGVPTDGEIITEEKVLSDIGAEGEQYRANQRVWANEMFPGDSMTMDEKVAAFEKKVSEYRQNPKMEITSEVLDYVMMDIQASNNLTKSINLLSSARKKQEQAKKDYIAEDKTAVTANGINYTKSDIYDFTTNLPKLTSTTYEPVGGTPIEEIDDDKVINFFKSYKGGKLLPIASAYVRNNKTFTVLNDEEKKLVGALKAAYSDIKEASKLGNEAFSNQMYTFSPKYGAKVATLNMSNKADLESVKGLLTAKAYQKNQLGESDVEKVGDYADNLGEIIVKPGTLVNFEVKKDGKGMVIITDGVAKKTYKIPVLPNEVSTYFKKATEGSDFEPLRDDILDSPGHTTNTANLRGATPENAVNARYTGYDLPGLRNSRYAGLVRFDVEGRQNNTGDSQKDGYDFNLYVYDPFLGIWKAKTINNINNVSGGRGYINEQGILDIRNSLNESNILEAIKNWK